jgi:hypothetical protein
LDGLGSSVCLDLTLAASFAHIAIITGYALIIQLSKELRVEHMAWNFLSKRGFLVWAIHAVDLVKLFLLALDVFKHDFEFTFAEADKVWEQFGKGSVKIKDPWQTVDRLLLDIETLEVLGEIVVD